MKRKISVILLIVILFNSIFSKYCYAVNLANPGSYIMQDIMRAYTIEAYNSLNNDGSAEIRGKDKEEKDNNIRMSIGQTKSSKHMLVVYLTTIFDMLPIAVHGIISVLSAEGYNYKDEGGTIYFTILSLIKNERQIFNANFFNFESTSDTNNKFKESVAVWYNVIRSLAMIISLLMLIYIGIRMAMSTTAIDKARYKKLLIGWVESFLVIWMIPYILSIAMSLSDTLLEWINEWINRTEFKVTGFETTIITTFFDTIVNNVNYEIVYWSVAYWILMWYELKFFIAYAKRFLSIGFLIIISPLISVVYAIDKAGDGRAQSFGNLLKELLVNIFIQPLHLIIYVIFIGTANNIATVAPILAVIFLAALSRTEKIVKNVFNMRGLTSIHSLGGIMPLKKKH